MVADGRAVPAVPVSPLGRYARGRETGAVVRVALLRIPLELYLEGRDHHDAVVRELRLLAVMTDPQERPEPLGRLIEVLGRGFADPGRRPDEAIEQAVDEGQEHIDLVFPMPAGVAAAAEELEALMQQADVLAEQGVLITLPRSAAVREFSAWYISQVVEQLAGSSAVPWPDRA